MTSIGLSIPPDGVGLNELEPTVRLAEELGYSDLWTSETNRLDAFAPALLAATWTQTMRIGTGVAGALTRGKALLVQQAAAVQEASEGRFVLGLGVSSREIVEEWNGCSFERPVSRLVESLADVRQALAGEETEGGFALERPPVSPPPVYLGALGPRSRQLAGRKADGLILNLAPRRHIPQLIRSLGPVPEHFEVVCHVDCFPGPRAEQEVPARWALATYLAVPSYGSFIAGLGYEEEVRAVAAAWDDGLFEEAMDVIPADLLEEVYAFGEVDEIKETLASYAGLGVSVPIAGPVVPARRHQEMMRALAPA